MLYVLNDDTFAAYKSFSLTVQEDSTIIIIPVIGAIKYENNTGKNYFTKATEALQCNVNAGSKIVLQNPYENETVNFLQLWMKKDISTPYCAKVAF